MLLKTAVASLCHTDGMLQSGIFPSNLPITASHEGTGEVVAVGSEVTGFRPGDRVMCGLMRRPCGECEDCQGPENYHQYCRNSMGAIGLGTDGAFAEYVVCDARTAAKIPDTVSFETAAPLACAGITVFRGVLLADLKKGQSVAIIGSGGGLGHLGVQFAKAFGLKVIGIDARPEGLELSRECGADVVIDVTMGKDQVIKEVQEATDGRGVDATINTSDASTAAEIACGVTRKHGQLIQLAQPKTVEIPFMELIFRDIRVRGSLTSSPDEARQMLQVVAEHGISVHTNIFYGLDKIPELVKLAHSGKMKGKGVVIVDEIQIEKQKQNVKGSKLA